ncbi:retrotransposon ORF1 [Tanacetum coccineum]
MEKDQASIWLERLPAGSITTWEDLTTRFLAQFFPPGRTAKLRNDILMFQQHHGESLSEAWTRFKDLLQKSPSSWHRPLAQKDLALCDNESWNNPRDFAKPVKAIALPQDVPSRSDHRLIELEYQVQCLMESHLALTQPTQVNKITTSCEICSGPHDTQYCMEDPKQAFVEYASSHTDEEGVKWYTFKPEKNNLDDTYNLSWKSHQNLSSINAITIHPKQPKESQVNEPDVGSLGNIRSNPYPQPGPLASIAIEQSPNEGEGTTTEGPAEEYFDTFPTRDELTYHKHVHVKKAYIDLNSPLNILTRMMYNWTIRRKLDPMENANGRISNFIERVKGMHVFIGNFTYVIDFMIVDDISSIIDPRLSQVVLGRPFIEISNMTHDLPEGVVRFTNKDDEVTYKMPYKIEQYNLLSNLEKEHTKLVYLRNEEDTRRGVNYVMSKILGFYKECLELGPEYVTGLDDKGEVTLYLMRRSLEVLRKFHWMILGG